MVYRLTNCILSACEQIIFTHHSVEDHGADCTEVFTRLHTAFEREENVVGIRVIDFRRECVYMSLKEVNSCLNRSPGSTSVEHDKKGEGKNSKYINLVSLKESNHPPCYDP